MPVSRTVDVRFSSLGIAKVLRMQVVVDVTTLKMARKPVKLQKESPAGCAGEGYLSK